MPDPLLILYLDGYHLGDTLFLERMARALAGRQARGASSLLVHGSGEAAERALEAEGLFPERRGGILQVETAAEAALVERVTRRTNARLVGLLTDGLVSAVALPGTSRNLIVRAADGRLVVRGAGWLEGLVRQGVVPVVSAVAVDAEQRKPREAAPADVLPALAAALEGVTPRVAFFVRGGRPGLVRGGKVVPTVAPDDLPGEDVVPEPEVVRATARALGEVLLTGLTALDGAGPPAGTRVEAS